MKLNVTFLFCSDRLIGVNFGIPAYRSITIFFFVPLAEEIGKLQEIQQRLKDEKALIEKNLENSQAENHQLQAETKQCKGNWHDCRVLKKS